MLTTHSTSQHEDTYYPSPFTAVAASNYNYEQLTDIYNRTRVDYIVPMPMNARRLQEYVVAYDVNLMASVVSLNADGEVSGIGMLGVRGDRTWITRLGVLPIKRRGGSGQFIMDHLIEQSHLCGASLIQLEVIKNNTPAHQLFLKCGFEETRELLIIRRPPGPPPENIDTLLGALVEPLSPVQIESCLAERDADASWLDETSSLNNGGNLQGLSLRTASGVKGWIVFQYTLFQLGRFVLCPAAKQNPDLALTLLYHVHRQCPTHDTKIENVPADSPLWKAYQKMGYIEIFRRVEMVNNMN